MSTSFYLQFLVSGEHPSPGNLFSEGIPHEQLILYIHAPTVFTIPTHVVPQTWTMKLTVLAHPPEPNKPSGSPSMSLFGAVEGDTTAFSFSRNCSGFSHSELSLTVVSYRGAGTVFLFESIVLLLLGTAGGFSRISVGRGAGVWPSAIVGGPKTAPTTCASMLLLGMEACVGNIPA